MVSFLDRNFQRSTVNRFVNDSDRFWRPEFHPRFRQIYEDPTDFSALFLEVNDHLSFPLPLDFVTALSVYFWYWLSDYRFVCIPTKDPQAKGQFAADVYFALLDVLPSIQYQDYPITLEDFNVVSNRAETGKVDTSNVAKDERIKNGTRSQTEQDLLTHTASVDNNAHHVESIDDRTDQNSKTVSDVFLSPQDSGVAPTTESAALSGVDGITLSPDDKWTTNTNNVIFGDTTKSNTNTIGADKTSENRIEQNADLRTIQDATNDMEGGQSVSNENVKSDNYVETLDFDKITKLADLYNLNLDRNWQEFLGRISKWILQANIATSERNYLDCDRYE